jgi:hypothetical protein
MVVLVIPVPMFAALIETPGINAPDVSLTVPLKVAFVV